MENLPVITSMPKAAGGTGTSAPVSTGSSLSEAESTDGFDSVLRRQIVEESGATPMKSSSDNSSGSGTAQENSTPPFPDHLTASDSLVSALLVAPDMNSIVPLVPRPFSILVPGVDISSAAGGQAGSLPLTEAMTNVADQAEIFAASGKTSPKTPPLHESTALATGESFAANQGEIPAASAVASRPGSADITGLSNGANVPLSLHAPAVASVANHHAQGAVQEPRLATAVGAPGWDSALAQKVIWQVGQQQQVAELHLNPPQLGPLLIQVSMSADQGTNIATAHFVSQHAAVRDAIEAAMPRLREMLAESGISLGNTTVGNGAFQQQNFSQAGSPHTLRRMENDFGAANDADGNMHPVRAVRNGMVDTFA